MDSGQKPIVDNLQERAAPFRYHPVLSIRCKYRTSPEHNIQIKMSSTSTTTMKAVHYVKPFQVTVKEVPLPKIEHPDDAILKVTTAGKRALTH